MGVAGFRLGPLRLTAYGAYAAVGVVAAMALSGRAARRVGVANETAWDVGLFAVVSCFAASRLLLVLGDVRAFIRYPLVVLGLPSLTFGGMALAAVAVWVYLRRRRLPVLPLLDAFAPGGAVLAAALELGHWAERTELGMPASLPWAAHLQGEVLSLQPVAAYGAALALLLAGGLWLLLGRLRRSGRVAALALVAGGLMAFCLDLITLPSAAFAGWWLEPGQVVALASMLAGAALWAFAQG